MGEERRNCGGVSSGGPRATRGSVSSLKAASCRSENIFSFLWSSFDFSSKQTLHLLSDAVRGVGEARTNAACLNDTQCVCILAPRVPLLTTGECENNSSCGGQRGQQKNSLWLSQRSNSVWPIEGFVTATCGRRWHSYSLLTN